MGKVGIKKDFSIFYIRPTSMHNCKSQIQWIGQILFIPTSIYIYIYARPHVKKYEVLSSGILYDVILIFATTSSKFSIYIKLLCNGKCIYSDVLIKFKESIYIFNFTCFELIMMDLKSHRKCRNKIQRICIHL